MGPASIVAARLSVGIGEAFGFYSGPNAGTTTAIGGRLME
jgi:hypothetical protein